MSNARHAASVFLVALAGCSAAHTPPDAGTIRCTSSGECYGPVPYCDPALGVCVPCRQDEDCRVSMFVGYECELASGECRECVTDAWCGPGFDRPLRCERTSHRCFRSCENDADCEIDFTSHPWCHESLGICVVCVTGPGCNPETHDFTVGCGGADDCAPDAPVCGSARRCTVSCDADRRCPEGRHCEPRSMVCVECTMNAHCPDSVCSSDFACLSSP